MESLRRIPSIWYNISHLLNLFFLLVKLPFCFPYFLLIVVVSVDWAPVMNV